MLKLNKKMYLSPRMGGGAGGRGMGGGCGRGQGRGMKQQPETGTGQGQTGRGQCGAGLRQNRAAMQAAVAAAGEPAVAAKALVCTQCGRRVVLEDGRPLANPHCPECGASMTPA
ncbi:MAG: hypothetical protein AB9872_16435 [Solidesulfovibrio sp.]